MKINKFITMIYGLLSNIKTNLHLVTKKLFICDFKWLLIPNRFNIFIHSNLEIEQTREKEKIYGHKFVAVFINRKTLHKF